MERALFIYKTYYEKGWSYCPQPQGIPTRIGYAQEDNNEKGKKAPIIIIYRAEENKLEPAFDLVPKHLPLNPYSRRSLVISCAHI